MSTLDGKLCGSQELHSQELAFGCDGISDRVDSLTELPGDQDVDSINNLLVPAADATHGAAVRLQATVRHRSVMLQLQDQALLHRLRCEAVWQEAAMRIQAAWRSYDAAVVDGVHIAAALIQAAWRSYDAAACIKAEYAAEAGAAAAAVRLQAAVRGCLQRVYWRSETWGSDAEGPPLTVTMHLIFKQEQQSDLNNEMLNGLAVEAAAATCIQAAERRRLVRGSLDRLRVLYPNAAALGLFARRVYGGSRDPNKNIFVFCSRTTRLPPLPKEVLVASYPYAPVPAAHADQAPRDQPVASGRALGNAAPQQSDIQPAPQGTPQGEGSSARAETAGTGQTGRRGAAGTQAERRRKAAARAAAAKAAAATVAALQEQCRVVELNDVLYWCDSAASKAAQERYWAELESDEEEEGDYQHGQGEDGDGWYVDDWGDTDDDDWDGDSGDDYDSAPADCVQHA